MRRPLVTQVEILPSLQAEQSTREVGVTYSTVNHWENGKRVPLPFLVKRLLEMKQELDENENKRPKGKTPR